MPNKAVIRQYTGARALLLELVATCLLPNSEERRPTSYSPCFVTSHIRRILAKSAANHMARK